MPSSPPVSTPSSNGHCPVLRTGAALGCNYCWNTNDSHGRILRRKTKYHCPDCQANLCIVPCFQVYSFEKAFYFMDPPLPFLSFDWQEYHEKFVSSSNEGKQSGSQHKGSSTSHQMFKMSSFWNWGSLLNWYRYHFLYHKLFLVFLFIKFNSISSLLFFIFWRNLSCTTSVYNCTTITAFSLRISNLPCGRLEMGNALYRISTFICTYQVVIQRVLFFLDTAILNRLNCLTFKVVKKTIP